jgi:hypothetical protein
MLFLKFFHPQARTMAKEAAFWGNQRFRFQQISVTWNTQESSYWFHKEALVIQVILASIMLTSDAFSARTSKLRQMWLKQHHFNIS